MRDIRPGMLITARLRLVRRVGKGGMGSVWVAYHETLGTEVAIKFVDAAATKRNAKALERFRREAAIAAKLKNPHVAHTYDHGVLGDGTPYIVMELLEGESLQQRLLGSGALSLHETALVLGQTAQALGKAHKMGIIHRDVKPGNIFLIDSDYELFVKLLDFGIAKHAVGVNEEELTKTGNLLGSPFYMSPEQFTKVKNVDLRADLWSLAVVAYRCLTTSPPFSGEAIGNVIMAVMQQNYRPITEARPELPAALDDWFAKAFHRNIEQRHQSAKELAVSFVEITRSDAGPDEPRASLPSITEMTHAALDSQSRQLHDITAELPEAWRPVASPPDITAKLNGDTAKLTAEVATFAPSATTVNEERGTRRLVRVTVGAAALLLIVVLGTWIEFEGEDETAAASAVSPSVPVALSNSAQPTVEAGAVETPAPKPSAITSAESEVTAPDKPKPKHSVGPAKPALTVPSAPLAQSTATQSGAKHPHPPPSQPTGAPTAHPSLGF